MRTDFKVLVLEFYLQFVTALARFSHQLDGLMKSFKFFLELGQRNMSVFHIGLDHILSTPLVSSARNRVTGLDFVDYIVAVLFPIAICLNH